MNLPPIAALDVLETLSRTGSVRDTADAVRLSQSAVSHKLRALEDRLGFRLTEPQGRGIALTPQARRYVASIRPALALLRDAHRGIAMGEIGLDVAVSSGLAATWLAPRLGGFLNLYPELSLTLRSATLGDPAPQADLAILFTDSPPPGAQHLMDVAFFPVCSPDFHYRHAPLTPDTLTADMLLHLENRRDWALWLETSTARPDPAQGGLSFTGLLAMYAAAEAGLGLCLGDAITSARALSTGRLLRPFDTALSARAAYWIAPPTAGFSPAASAFAAWLQEEIAATTSPSPMPTPGQRTPR